MPMAQPLVLTPLASGAPSHPQTLKTPLTVARVISYHIPMVVSVKYLRCLCPNMDLFTQSSIQGDHNSPASAFQKEREFLFYKQLKLHS